MKLPLPDRFFSRTFRSPLYSSPMNPSRSRKHRKAYFSLSAGRSFAVTRFCFLAISQSAVMKCVYAFAESPSCPSVNQGKEF